MNRRDFFATLLVARPSVATTQFFVTGHFDKAGEDPSMAYYSLGQSVSLMLDPAKVPAMVEQANKLVGRQARIHLEAV
jgi:hypothetical protein